MIQFNILTWRAELNAWPCVPDEFEIIVTERQRLYTDQWKSGGDIQRVFRCFDFRTFERHRDLVMHFKRVLDDTPLKANNHHDVIMVNYKSQWAKHGSLKKVIH